MQENIGMKGRFRIEKISPDGNIEIRENPNTVVTIGKAMMANLLVDDLVYQTATGSRYDWMAIGIGSRTIGEAGSLLGSEYLKYGLGSITGSTTTTTTTNDTALFIGSFGIDATKTINEAGLFNKSGLNLGSVLAMTTFTVLNVISGDRVNATWNIQFS